MIDVVDGSLETDLDARKNVEIEKKYHFDDHAIFNQVTVYLEKQKVYNVEVGRPKEQVDVYYDTAGEDLKKHNSTLRIRQKDDNFELTIKKQAGSKQNDEQKVRFEFQKQIQGNSLLEETEFIFKNLEFLDGRSLFLPRLTVRNLRTPIILQCKKIIFELAYDHVVYENLDEKCVKDYQIEIELKSDNAHRFELKLLSDDIEKNVAGLLCSRDSKYLRGLELLSEK